MNSLRFINREKKKEKEFRYFEDKNTAVKFAFIRSENIISNLESINFSPIISFELKKKRKNRGERKENFSLDYRNGDFEASVSGESWRSPALDLPSAEFQPGRIDWFRKPAAR